MAVSSSTNPSFSQVAIGLTNIYSGTGAPTLSAPQGSIYLRTDGSSIATRLYINTTGSTIWTAVSTVA